MRSRELVLPYDPGILPTKPQPHAGETIQIEMTGLPPFKQLRASLRNPKGKNYQRFAHLREAATTEMRGRAWYQGPVAMEFTLRGPTGLAEVAGVDCADGKRCTLLDYAAGIEDTLDGSHGFSFTYLPVVFEDDCQIVVWRSCFLPAETTGYSLVVRFL